MDLGITLASIYKDNFQETLEYAEILGINHVEILDEYPTKIKDLDLLESFNLKYTIHAPINDLNIASLNKSIRKASIYELEKSIDLANKINSDIIVIHPAGYTFLGAPCEEKILSNCKESLKDLRDYSRDYDVEIAVENMPNIEGFIYSDIYKLHDLLVELEMSMTLDVGHASTAGFKEEELYFSNVRHVHLSDNFGDEDLHLALGEGNIDFKKIIDTYKKNNYKGKYILELIFLKDVKNSIDFLDDLK
jgi:sugar phosphate isomerase/epimerase